MAEISSANLLIEKLDGSCGAVLVDVRPPNSSEAIDGVFRTLIGVISAPLQDGVPPLSALPTDKDTVLIVFCRSGRRAGAAVTYLIGEGYTNVYNAGGPAGDKVVWQALVKRQGEVLIPHAWGRTGAV
jgi:rhodanese-related sulfurtransferase